MARKLKTFVTSIGFFDLAVAAPSMKAALELWGMERNAFDQGFAHQTDDAKIIEATIAKPGVVLKRPVGTKGMFKEDADLPTTLPAGKAPAAPSRKKPEKAKPKARTTPPRSEAEDRKAVISFRKEKARRDRERAKAEAAEKRAQEKRDRDIGAAEAELERAEAAHQAEINAIAAERDKLDAREEREEERWEGQKKKLDAAIRNAGR